MLVVTMGMFVVVIAVEPATVAQSFVLPLIP